MRRSRLRLFKITSMSISALGILMIIATVLIFIYVGVDKISSTLSLNVEKSSAYDELAQLKREYSSLELGYDSVKIEINNRGDEKLKEEYIEAEMKLIEAKSAIDDVESALSTDKPISEVKNRINIAMSKLQEAKDSLNNLKGLL